MSRRACTGNGRAARSRNKGTLAALCSRHCKPQAHVEAVCGHGHPRTAALRCSEAQELRWRSRAPSRDVEGPCTVEGCPYGAEKTVIK